MSGRFKPCDGECMAANGCAGYRYCERCGEGFCAFDDSDYCEDCAAEIEAEESEETEEE